MQDKEVADVSRKLTMIWNMYDFFTLYADIDQWDWDGSLDDPSPNLSNPLDRWIISRVHQLNEEVDNHMQRYDLPNALKPVLPFIDDASNWYVRRSRKRYWKSEDDIDKKDAYSTLHYVLVHLSMIMAPFTPFLAEELYRKLTNGESVHLLDWPEVGHIDELVLKNMSFTRQIISEGLAQRAEAGIKVRQPLQSVNIDDESNRLTDEFKEIITEELNVKELQIRPLEDSKNGDADNSERPVAMLDLKLTPELRQEGLMREIVRNVQQARKQANLEVDDRITLGLKSDVQAITTLLGDASLTDTIQQETLATSLNKTDIEEGFSKTVKIDGYDLTISLKKI
jgi:isoleucyl-tRNA synthetase